MATNSTLAEKVQHLAQLVIAGETLQVLQLYYDDQVQMQENETPPRIGKEACVAFEKRMLGVAKEFETKLLHYAINETQDIAFLEWEICYTTHQGESFKLTEVAVQHWANGKVIYEKFYYKEALKTSA